MPCHAMHPKTPQIHTFQSFWGEEEEKGQELGAYEETRKH